VGARVPGKGEWRWMCDRDSDFCASFEGTSGEELGLIGFVLDNVRRSLFVVLWHKPLFVLYLCSYCPF